MITKKRIAIISQFIMLFFFYLISTAEVDTLKIKQSSVSTNNKNIFRDFKGVISPSFSLSSLIPAGTTTHYGILDYGIKIMYRPARIIIFEIGYSISPLKKVNENYIQDFYEDVFHEEIEITKITKSNAGKLDQFWGAIRLLTPPKGRNLPYFIFGVGNYKRKGNITASFSGQGSHDHQTYTFEDDIKITPTKESESYIYGGVGWMTLIKDKISVDFQVTLNKFFLKAGIAINYLL